jgi:hypothetical protein
MYDERGERRVERRGESRVRLHCSAYSRTVVCTSTLGRSRIANTIHTPETRRSGAVCTSRAPEPPRAVPARGTPAGAVARHVAGRLLQTMLRTSVCLLAGAHLATAQGSLSDDVAVLMAFKAYGANSYVRNYGDHGAPVLDTWVAGVDPCAAGFDDPNSGFAEVMCCDAYSARYDSNMNSLPCTGSNARRVTYLYVVGEWRVDGDVSGFAGLTQLSVLSLHRTSIDGDLGGLAGSTQLTHLTLSDTGVYGDVATLVGLTQLTHLSLSSTAVYGDVAVLVGLTQLTYVALDGTSVYGDVAVLVGLTQLEVVSLYDTSVYGDMAGLAGMMTQLEKVYWWDTDCYGDISAFPSQRRADMWTALCYHWLLDSDGACPAGHTPVSSPNTYVGSNACACCSGTQKLLDSGTGLCVDHRGA